VPARDHEVMMALAFSVVNFFFRACLVFRVLFHLGFLSAVFNFFRPYMVFRLLFHLCFLFIVFIFFFRPWITFRIFFLFYASCLVVVGSDEVFKVFQRLELEYSVPSEVRT
jgi:hypothetical protein